jgi:excisionase family DNA binding protein
LDRLDALRCQAEKHDKGYYVGYYRVTIQEAAKRLGVKDGAIRKRIERGTIESDKDVEGGRVYVYVDAPPIDEAGPGYDERVTGYDAGNDTAYPAGYDMLIRSQQEQIEFLQRELERKDALLLNMTEVMKAINPPSEPRESPVKPSQEQGDGDMPPEKEKRSWLHRFFFGP